MRQFLVSFLLACVLALSSYSERAQAQDTLRAAAVVNDEVVSMLDLAMRTKLAILSAGLEDSPETRRRLQQQVLRSLIDERLQLQEARRLDIDATEEQIDEAIRRLASQNNLSAQNFLRLLQQNGVLPSVMRDQIRATLAWQLVLNNRLLPTVEVTDEEVDAVVRRIESDSGGMEYWVSEIFLAVDNVLQEDEVKATAGRLVEQLRGGANFLALARQFSQSSTASVGGDLGWVREGQLPEELTATLKNMRPGQISRPIGTLNGVYLLWLRDQRERNLGDVTLTMKQVLFPLPQGANEEELKQAAQRANSVRPSVDSCDAADRIARELGVGQAVDIGEIKLEAMPAKIRAVVSATPAGQPTEPIRVPAGIALLLVCDRDEGDIDRDKIRDSLVNERVTLLARRYLRDLRRAANVDLRT